MKRYKTTFNLVAAAASGLALTGMSANAATVWNINIGATDLAGYQGAAAENAATGSSWNAVTSTDLTTLDDSAGSNAAGVTFKVDPAAGSAIDFGGANITGDDIFDTYMKDGNGGGGDNVNDDPFTVTFGNLGAGASYDVIVYSDWFWGPNALRVAQTVGTGLTGTYHINSSVYTGTKGFVGPLLEDTDAANTAGDFNYARFNLVADGSGVITLQMGQPGASFGDNPTNGFQLVQVPEPGSVALLSLGGLALILRRRK